MSQYTQETKPFFQAITNGRKDEEEKELQQIKKDKESGASASSLNSRIEAMGNRMYSVNIQRGSLQNSHTSQEKSSNDILCPSGRIIIYSFNLI